MKSVSKWFWVIGSVLAALLIFVSAFSFLQRANRMKIEERDLEQFDELKAILDELCWDFPGTKRKKSLSLGEEVIAIYAAPDKYTQFEKEEFVEKIEKGEVSRGKFLCIKMEGRRLKCKEIECEFSMPFLGATPSQPSLKDIVNQILGRGKTFTYSLSLEKKEKEVEIKIE